jgi:hypothetical protein
MVFVCGRAFWPHYFLEITCGSLMQAGAISDGEDEEEMEEDEDEDLLEEEEDINYDDDDDEVQLCSMKCSTSCLWLQNGYWSMCC